MPITMQAATFGIGARADHDAEVKIQIGAELKAAVSMRQRDRALDIVRYCLASRIRDIVYGKDRNVVAHTDHDHSRVGSQRIWMNQSFEYLTYQRLVFRLCVWT